MREFIGNIVGMNIQYSAHVNYSVVRDIVNAVGPITITIEGSAGDPGIMDSNFDWKCGVAVPSLTRTAAQKAKCPPNGHFIDYPNGPATLDAEHALYVAQARGDCVPIPGGCMPTYGLSRSNYDRELNQQKIIKAIKEKAVSAGTLTDLGKVNNLIGAIGDNLRTNFDSGEIRTLVSLAKDIPSDQIKSISLIDATPTLFTGDGENNVVPVAGMYDYSDIQAYIKKQISADPVVKEAAHVIVLNGSGVAGVAKSEGDKLTPLGMTVDQFANAPAGSYPASIIYNVTGTKTKTADKLAQIYGVTPVTTTPPITVPTGVDFVIIVASPSAAQATSTNQ
jgi:anionic cell wall polymer biosynthesis LytR-Cps2A-Psr (LCP) family protein